MKATGIVRNVDNLGRISVPAELRKAMGVRTGDRRWAFHPRNYEIVSPTSTANAALHITITTDGVATTATLLDGQRVIRTGVARCDPRDTFNFDIGSKLAFDRLMRGQIKAKVSIDTTEVVRAIKTLQDALAELPSKATVC